MTSSTYGATDTTATTSQTTTTTSSNNLVTTAPSTTTATNDNGQATTTVLPNGSSVTRLETTTIVYPDGTTKTYNGSTDTSMASSSGSTTTVPAGSKVITKTVTTVTLPPNSTQVVTVPSGMASSSTSTNTYQPVPVAVPYNTSGRRIPGLDFLVFADRASFSQTNSFPGTLNTGDLRTDIRNQTGYGLGLNAWFNRHFSGEITASRIHPQTNFTPANAAVNPITGLRLRMTPITGTLQLHFNPYSTVDAYLGGGAAYVLLKSDRNFNAGNTGITNINFRDEWGPLVNGGLGFNVSRHFGINLDAKYMWIRARANSTFNTATIGNVGNAQRWGLNPFIISAGLRFGF